MEVPCTIKLLWQNSISLRPKITQPIIEMDTFLKNKPGNPGLKIEANNFVSLSGKTFLVFVLSQIKTNILFFLLQTRHYWRQKWFKWILDFCWLDLGKSQNYLFFTGNLSAAVGITWWGCNVYMGVYPRKTLFNHQIALAPAFHSHPMAQIVNLISPCRDLHLTYWHDT